MSIHYNYSDTQPNISQRTYRQVESRDVPEIMQQGAAIIDVRRPDEWRLTGIISGSHLLTFFDSQGNSCPDEWLCQLDHLVPLEQPLLLI